MAWYRLGDGHLGVDSDDRALQDRFRVLFGECEVPTPEVAGPRVICIVRCPPDRPVAVIQFVDPEPLDTVAFAAALFPGRGLHEIPSPATGWRFMVLEQEPEMAPVAVHGSKMLAQRTGAWQSLIGNLALNRTLRLQREHLFFHAASVAVAGRGALLIGPKGAGKTTLALGLAARGHGFFGDEIAAVRTRGPELLPFRRSVSVRPGPAVEAAEQALRDADAPTEPFPDGTVRRRVEVRRLFPAAAAPGPVPLGAVVLLGPRKGEARAVRFTPGREHLGRLSPLGSTLWGAAPALRLIRLLGMLTAVSCFHLEAGSPEGTVDLLERTLGEG
ncbi:MAG: hypothetical protein ACREMO_05435 [Gemmatimonadales bacterium]